MPGAGGTTVDSAISSVRENCQNIQTTAMPFPDEGRSLVKKFFAPISKSNQIPSVFPVDGVPLTASAAGTALTRRSQEYLSGSGRTPAGASILLGRREHTQSFLQIPKHPKHRSRMLKINSITVRSYR